MNEIDERDVFFELIVQKDCFELREMGDRLIDVKDLLIAGFYYLMGESVRIHNAEIIKQNNKQEKINRQD